MSERKVLNKYIPPDFDPSQLPKGKRPKGGQVTVRIMLPMSVQCSSCNEYVYKGKKFNAKKEMAIGEDYLGIKIWRFFFRCPHCMKEITFKTDPKNADYVCEAGAYRNFEPWRQEAQAEQILKEIKEGEERGDTMRQLENRTIESKREMDVLDALEEIREMNNRNAGIALDEVLDEHMSKGHSLLIKQDQEDEAAIAAAFGKGAGSGGSGGSGNGGAPSEQSIELPLEDDDDNDDYDYDSIVNRISSKPSLFASLTGNTESSSTPSPSPSSLLASASSLMPPPAAVLPSSVAVIVKKKKDKKQKKDKKNKDKDKEKDKPKKDKKRKHDNNNNNSTNATNNTNDNATNTISNGGDTNNEKRLRPNSDDTSS